jgi:undecaprenyl phosphate N,N'-diacetylbacillosamine 1-phosphate transferase
MYRNVIKRCLDFTFAFVGLLVLSPIFVFVGTCLAISNKGRVFFFQARPGKNRRVFNVVKFKTMKDDRDDTGQLLPDERRLTRIGEFIRKTSLDEIPQLLNVLKGEMSLVGPRPLLVDYLELYNTRQHRRHEVRPGITGWAQVNGRNAISWTRRLEYDVWYVDNISFYLDLKIIVLTISKVLRAEGVSSRTSVTMERFNGNN